MNNTDSEQSMPRGAVTIAAAVAVVNAAVSVGYAIAAVVSEPVAVAWYAADRAVALLVAAVVVAWLRRAPLVALVCWILVAVQAMDAVVGLAGGDIAKTVGPAVLAAITAVAAARVRTPR